MEHFKFHPHWPLVLKVLDTLTGAGYQAFLVGGSVRDAYLKIPLKDFDIATNARPEETQALFKKTVDVGKDFGVIGVVVDGVSIEVTTFREESEYNSKRQPLSVKFTDLEGDASRRDFTMNALYYDVSRKKLIDPFSGVEDIKARRLRAIGDASERLREDPLRILRAIRFSSRFSFSLDPDLDHALRVEGLRLQTVAKERVFDELQKAISFETWRDVVRMLWDFKCFKPLGLSEVSDQRQSKILSLHVEGGFPEVCAWMWGDLLLDELKKNLQTLKASNDFRDAVLFFVFRSQELLSKNLRRGELYELFHLAPIGFLNCLKGFSELERKTRRFDQLEVRFHEMKSLLNEKGELPAPLASGEELQKRGIKKGPELGAFKRELYYQQLEGEFKSLKQLNEKLKELRRTSSEV